jgi:hypothetical protein
MKRPVARPMIPPSRITPPPHVAQREQAAPCRPVEDEAEPVAAAVVQLPQWRASVGLLAPVEPAPHHSRSRVISASFAVPSARSGSGRERTSSCTCEAQQPQIHRDWRRATCQPFETDC